ncbi:dTDP-4-dehydrorhamnose reductase [Pseudomaricurvus sp. HS19]|uniref:dTDP-4-dehydrorhamnose reductase n=1 Tax=Pseudomaricurvus sp. HS19 TaxID=2692626 RepID=UPI00136E9955|nr:dTDP-4-dehydrorhamnose reductase [Pseudomaricurvus sp. HS19]MYM65142.1 dTDP-4-dehydrorhamnose reductase [Pseudomaricurvus sp. HS19]
MKVLLFGANGQVGSACRQSLTKAGLDVVALTRADADFAEPMQVISAVQRHAPQFVVNACAYTAVDKAESEEALAQMVNGDSVGLLAQACAAQGIPLLHISTDYVFNGKSDRPYTESDPVDPMGVYGASKLAGERQLQVLQPQHIILRTSWVFGEQGNNFVKTMVRLGQSRPELGVVADQVGCPTYAGDIARVITEFVTAYSKDHELPWGIYHCSNQGQCSWYDFACAIFAEAVEQGILPRAPKVNPITTADYPTPAARPAWSVLDTGRLNGWLSEPMPHWQQGLKSVLASLQAS